MKKMQINCWQEIIPVMVVLNMTHIVSTVPDVQISASDTFNTKSSAMLTRCASERREAVEGVDAPMIVGADEQPE